MPAGRPSDYDPAYCDDVIAWGKRGKSKAWMAAHLNISRQTMENWSAAHPEFMDALGISAAYSQCWWEDAGQDGMEDGSINASIWSRSMSARFPADWREVKGTELTGKLELTSKEQRDAAVAAALQADT